MDRGIPDSTLCSFTLAPERHTHPQKARKHQAESRQFTHKTPPIDFDFSVPRTLYLELVDGRMLCPLVNLRLNSCGYGFRCSRSAGRDFDRAQQLRTLAVWEQRSRSGDIDWSNDRVAETDGVSARRSELPRIRNGHRAGKTVAASSREAPAAHPISRVLTITELTVMVKFTTILPVKVVAYGGSAASRGRDGGIE